MFNYNLTVSAQSAQNSQANAVTLPLTQEQFLQLLGDPVHPVKLTVSLSAEMLTEAEIQVDAAIIASSVKLGDYVMLCERQDNGEMNDVLYQYVVAPDGKHGLLRASRLGDDRPFDSEDYGNVYVKSTLKKFVDDWAAKQDFDAFVAEVSLLELPRADTSNEAWEENCNYVLSLRLSEDLNWIWTKTASSSFASDVWYVNAYDSAYPVRTYHALGSNGVSPALWLKSDVLIGGGHGTKEDPHHVMLE